jgi:O-antigen ligase
MKGSRRGVVDRSMPLGLAGGLVVFVLTIVASSGAVGVFRAASISYTAIVATVTAALTWTVVLLYNRVPARAVPVAAAFAAFGMSALGSALIGGATRQGVQFLVVQFSFLGALLLAATARRVVGRRLDGVVARCFRVTACLFIAVTVFGAIGVGISAGARPLAIVALVGLGWFLAEYRSGNGRSLWWSVAIVVGIAVSLSRTALLAAFVLVLASVLLASGARRTSRVFLILVFAASGVWAVTAWTPLHNRFVKGDVSLSIGGIDINAEGRTQIWAALWSQERGEPLILGHGPGSASARAVAIAPESGHPHNDYLRLLYDFGVVGIGLWAWFVIRTARQLRQVRKNSPRSIPALAALNAAAGILIVMATDNPLDYPFVMISLGALLGLGLGVSSARARNTTADDVRVLKV